jgi:hypothetical protein
MSGTKGGSTEVTANRVLAEKFPSSTAFAKPEDMSVSHAERLKLHDLEQLIGTANELIAKRSASYSSADHMVHSHAAVVDKSNIPSYASLATKRAEALRQVERPDPSPPILSYGDLLANEVLALDVERNTYAFTVATLRDFFTSRLHELAASKYLLLKRWARFCNTADSAETYFPALDSRLRDVERQMEACSNWLTHAASVTGLANDRGQAVPVLEPQSSNLVAFDADAFRVFLRHEIHRSRSTRKLSRFLKKVQWLPYSKRGEIFEQFYSSEGIFPDGQKLPKAHGATKIPLIAKFLEDLDEPLKELIEAFEVTAEFSDEGQEFFYMVSKKFNQIFVAQTSSFRFDDYPTSIFVSSGAAAGSQVHGDESEADGGTAATSADPVQLPYNLDLDNTIFVKHADWLDDVPHVRMLDAQQERQRVILDKAVRVDHVLRVEAAFLESADLPQATKRLKEQVDVHLQRSLQAQNAAGTTTSDAGPQVTGVHDGAEHDGAMFAGPGRRAGTYVDIEERERLMMKHKLLSVYFLRYLRTREFRRRILDSLNFMRSVERRVTLDQYGFAFERDSTETSPMRTGAFKEDVPSCLAGDHRFASPARLQLANSEAIMSMGSIVDRDDVYVAIPTATNSEIDGCDVRVKDSRGVFVMYDCALKDLEELSAELVRLGSHYVSQHDRVFENEYAGSGSAMHQASRASASIAARLMQGAGGMAGHANAGGAADDFLVGKFGNGRPFSDVDRMSMLEDLFESEAWLQAAKKKLLDALLDVYEHATDKSMRERLSTMMLDVIARRPRYDLESEYFSQAYASEIVLLELQASLLKSLASHQLAEEHATVTATYQKLESFLEAHPECADGYPLPLTPQIPGCDSVSLLPHGLEVGVFDVYSTLPLVFDVIGLMESGVRQLLSELNVRGSLQISTMHRIVSQLVIVEWRLLLEEEKFAKSLSGPAAVGTERNALIEDPEATEMIARDFVAEFREAELKVAALNRDPAESTSTSTNRTASASQVLLSTSGFPIDTTDSAMLQLLASSIELLLQRKALLDALFECDILFTIYRDQATLMGHNVKTAFLDPLQFMSGPNDKAEKDRRSEVLSLRGDYLTNLAITEFEGSMGHFDFYSSNGVKKLLSQQGVSEFRRALQVQTVHKNLLVACIQHNQILLDILKPPTTYQSTVFLTDSSVSRSDGRPKTAVVSQALSQALTELFVSITSLKQHYRALVLRDYNERCAPIFKTKSPEIIQKKLRELKFELVHTFCRDITTELRLVGSRIHLVSVVRSLRQVLECDMDGKVSPFSLTTASSGSSTNNTSTDNSATFEFIRSDGSMASLFAVPSIVDAVRMLQPADSFDFGKAKRSTYLLKSVKLYSAVLDIVYLMYIRGKMTVGIGEDVLQNGGLEGAPHDFAKLRDELDHVSDPTDPDVVLRYLSSKRRLLFTKVLVSLRNVRKDLSPTSLTSLRVFEHAWVVLSDPYFATDVLSDMDCDSALLRARHLRNVVDGAGAPSSVWYSVAATRRVPFSVHHAQCYGPFVGCIPSSFFSKMRHLGLLLGDAERNYLTGEETSLDLLLDDLLSEEKVYSTSQSELAVSMQIGFLESSLTLARLKQTFLQRLAPVRGVSVSDTAAMAELYKQEVLIDVKPTIESFKALNDALASSATGGEKSLNVPSTGSSGAAGNDAFEDPVPMPASALVTRIAMSASRKLSESLIRMVQILLLHQRLHGLLICSQFDDLQQLVSRLQAVTHTGDDSALQVAPPVTGTTDANLALEEKAAISNEFLHMFMSRCIKKRSTEDETIIMCEVSKDHLDLCLDSLVQKVVAWKSNRVEQRSLVLKQTVAALSGSLFAAESRMRYLNHSSEMDRRALKRRVQIELADRNYELLYALDELTKENERLQKGLVEQEIVLRRRIEAEFQDRMEALDRELTITKGKFDEYRTYLYREMQNNLMEVKKEAMLKMVESENAPLELKRKALKIARFDDEIARVKEENMEMKKTIMKMSLFSALRQASIRSKYDRLLRREVHERERLQRDFWANRERVEERETILRQQLVATQNALHAAEMELEQLRKDLGLQMKNKQQLVHWKVRNAQVMAELEAKVRKFERFANVDVDKLLIDMEKKDQALRQMVSVEDKVAKAKALVEEKKDKEIRVLQRKLADEQKVKAAALARLDNIRMEMEMDVPEQVQMYRDRYEMSLQDLRRAMTEIDELRLRLMDHKLDVPGETILADPHVVAAISTPAPELGQPAASGPGGSASARSRRLPSVGSVGVSRPASGSATRRSTGMAHANGTGRAQSSSSAAQHVNADLAGLTISSSKLPSTRGSQR